MAGSQEPDCVSTKQQRIATLGKRFSERSFTSLAHYMDLSWLEAAYRRTRKDGAVGIDGQTAVAYEQNLMGNLQSLLERAKSGCYWAPPVRRVHIPKGDGRTTRPIGIPTLEDKVLQRAVTMILEPLFEQDFEDSSYGFRPGRSAHQALDALWRELMPMGGGWVLELDIQAFFDQLDRQHLRGFFQQRVRDGVICRLIDKWLKAGVLDAGQLSCPQAGTPQGGVASPLLANVYLHVVLDRWIEREVKPRLKGRCFLVRYADDGAPRRRIGGRKSSVQPCCTRDEGGPLEAAVQAEASNHPLLLHLRDGVASGLGKGRARPCQVRIVESNASEPLMKCRKRRNEVKTGGKSLTRDQSERSLLTAQMTSGIEAARTRSRLLCGTWEPVTPMLREPHKWRPHECQSTEAGYRGGATHSSKEGPVIGLERRGCPIQPETGEQPAMGGLS